MPLEHVEYVLGESRSRNVYISTEATARPGLRDAGQRAAA